jgi:hypothetical protein
MGVQVFAAGQHQRFAYIGACRAGHTAPKKENEGKARNACQIKNRGGRRRL